MTELLKFFDAHCFLAFTAIACGATVLMVVVFYLINLVRFVVFMLPNRLLRHISICVRGWPPSHLDADGDAVRDDED